MKTSALTGRALDYAVALAEGHKLCDWWGKGVTRFNGLQVMLPNGGYLCYILDSDATRAQVAACEDSSFLNGQRYWRPTRTAEGDDIIDREHIATDWHWNLDEPCWSATIRQHSPKNFRTEDGTTRREAAMRCFVAWKLGDEIDIPGELK